MDVTKLLKRRVTEQTTLGTLHSDETAIRQARTDLQEFADLTADIDKNGILFNPYTTNPKPLPEGQTPLSPRRLVDGVQRTAALRAGHRARLIKENPNLEEDTEKLNKKLDKVHIEIYYIPNMTEDEVRQLQTTLNIQRIANTRRELAEQMKRTLADNDFDIPQLADFYNKSPAWVQQVLQLNKLDKRLDYLMETSKEGQLRKMLPGNVAIMLSQIKDGDEQVRLINDGLLDLEPDARDAKLAEAVTNYKKGVKTAVGTFTEPKPRFVKSTWEKKCEAALAANETQFHQGLLSAVGVSTEDIDAKRAEHNAKTLEKKSGSIEDQIVAAKARIDALTKQKEALNGTS